MLRTFMRRLIVRAKEEKNTIIVGAGKNGRELLRIFQKEDVNISCFMDNDTKLHGTEIEGVRVLPVSVLEDESSLYVISAGIEYRNEIHSQLCGLGIPANSIVKWYKQREYDYMKELPEKYFKDEVMDMYSEGIGKEMNWEHPQTYNEKISWEKLNVHDPLKTRLADKYLVRDWIKEKLGGEEHLTKLYGVWEDARDIDFSTLPEQFVLKTNHGCGCNIVVQDKNSLNIEEAIIQLNEWMNHNYFYNALEYQYKDIPPKIICEEYLDGVADSVYDYQFYCFHGEPKYIWCIRGSHKPDCKASFYTKDWEMLPFSYGYPKDETVASRPRHLEDMLKISRILCEPFAHVRVDLYDLPDGRVICGEMTFTTWAGRWPFEPDEWDAIWGKLI